MATQKIFDQLLVFVNLYQHAKNQFIPSILESHHQIDTPVFDHAQPKDFRSIFNFCELLST